MSTESPASYPISFEVDVAEHDRDRVSVAFRIILAIPILLLAATVGGGEITRVGKSGTAAGAAGGLVAAGPALMILFRQKYPRWWFDWNAAFMAFVNRVAVYVLLLRDEYPSTDEEQSSHLTLPYPDVKRDLNRWMPLVKWFLAIPHYFVLIVLEIGVIFATIGAWFAILFTGSYPSGMARFVVGTMRWHNRVVGYAFALVTDEYPPFRLAA